MSIARALEYERKLAEAVQDFHRQTSPLSLRDQIRQLEERKAFKLWEEKFCSGGYTPDTMLMHEDTYKELCELFGTEEHPNEDQWEGY